MQLETKEAARSLHVCAMAHGGIEVDERFWGEMVTCCQRAGMQIAYETAAARFKANGVDADQFFTARRLFGILSLACKGNRTGVKQRNAAWPKMSAQNDSNLPGADIIHTMTSRAGSQSTRKRVERSRNTVTQAVARLLF